MRNKPKSSHLNILPGKSLPQQSGNSSVAPANDLTKLNAEISLSLDELGERHYEIYTQNTSLVSLIEKGMPLDEALKQLNIDPSEPLVRILISRYRKDRYKGLNNKRWGGANNKTSLTPQVKKLILAIYFTFPAAGGRAIWNKLREQCRNRQLPEVSESSVRRFLASLPEAYKIFRKGVRGIRLWERATSPVFRYENTIFGNER